MSDTQSELKGRKARARRVAVWRAGYYCAVAQLLDFEGMATPLIRDIFAQGGDPNDADEHDKEKFREHGLMAARPAPTHDKSARLSD